MPSIVASSTIVASLGLFATSFILCVVAVSTPMWLDRESFGTHTRLGIVHQCWPSLSGSEYCMVAPIDQLPVAWQAAYCLMVVGMISLFGAILCSLGAWYNTHSMRIACNLGFFAACLLALATLIFPGGFSSPLVSGKAFKLPENVSVGYSYILFILSTLFAFLAELFAARIILPVHF
ncbi:hypothetical protein CAOG_00125 [Capsaspora owczarzaki ATCC 30864]|uniref:Uncharacterized protein n=1 Tax=Capsaspora owczarzaki (strain ATCC 30864) TaxID=595528 RepID=A0A0D2VFG1_CAPO3|nr:hypothetical protein CAOG_00125 [Capsaspora owczarzaki ATCC 30864]KJE88472.1 hypothetical protein CAOG_000125 [Capsaspora owczarzaki ATCC 30864]|eukprot:XP_004364996.1 hypothetical protein CAOG_00125 [Capsaspora owczarzaki ATCC 30864]